MSFSRKLMFPSAVGVLWVLAQVATAATIGPDTYGYIASSDVPYPYSSIVGTPNAWALDIGDDSGSSQAFGFNFNFYGASYDHAVLYTNGVVQLGGNFDSNNAYWNKNLTQAMSPDLPIIAPFWDDLMMLAPADALYYKTEGLAGNHKFTVQWNNLAHHGGTPVAGTLGTFQLVLEEATGNIYFYYPDVNFGSTSDNNGGGATVGIRGPGGNINGHNLQWSYNSAVLSDGMAIEFTTQGFDGAVPEPGTSLLVLGGLLLAAARVKQRRAI